MTITSSTVLALNSGSSSLKFGVFVLGEGEVRALYRGSLNGIGSAEGRLQIHSATNESIAAESHRSETQTDSFCCLVKALARLSLPRFAAIGHRIVHGGPSLLEHQQLTPRVLQTLESAAVFAPLHVPVELSLIREAEQQYPGVPQFVCFDTAFHRTLPEPASRFALPEQLWAAGVRRYGFHGISCESIVHRLGDSAPARMVIAHLGNGASITAVANGRSVDTSMGLTPTGGMVMGTRAGDLDPGVLLHLLRTGYSDAGKLEHLLDKESGLLGISGVSSDMRELHESSGNARIQLAIDVFARTAKKFVGAYAALLGGLDLLVFSGGIGEHDGAVRASICEGLEFLGLRFDSTRNAGNLEVISRDDSRIAVRIVPADEEIQIARQIGRLLHS